MAEPESVIADFHTEFDALLARAGAAQDGKTEQPAPNQVVTPLTSP